MILEFLLPWRLLAQWIPYLKYLLTCLWLSVKLKLFRPLYEADVDLYEVIFNIPFLLFYRSFEKKKGSSILKTLVLKYLVVLYITRRNKMYCLIKVLSVTMRAQLKKKRLKAIINTWKVCWLGMSILQAVFWKMILKRNLKVIFIIWT